MTRLTPNDLGVFLYDEAMKRYTHITFSPEDNTFVMYVLSEKFNRSSNDIDTFIRMNAKQVHTKQGLPDKDFNYLNKRFKKNKDPHFVIGKVESLAPYFNNVEQQTGIKVSYVEVEIDVMFASIYWIPM